VKARRTLGRGEVAREFGARGRGGEGARARPREGGGDGRHSVPALLRDAAERMEIAHDGRHVFALKEVDRDK
jgi:hypothetical protein